MSQCKFWLCLSSLLLLLSFSPSSESIDYIHQYKDLAVVEMQRSGIPASIILAQGVLESGNGKSTLALAAKNHFGIKCKNYWVGNTYYHIDDDRDESGNLIKSCFRSYDMVIDSYVDHTNFLMFTKYYTSLFGLSSTDYRSWAKGLKSCGYATDPKYAEKLINIIEKYDLHSFDK